VKLPQIISARVRPKPFTSICRRTRRQPPAHAKPVRVLKTQFLDFTWPRTRFVCGSCWRLNIDDGFARASYLGRLNGCRCWLDRIGCRRWLGNSGLRCGGRFGGAAAVTEAAKLKWQNENKIETTKNYSNGNKSKWNHRENWPEYVGSNKLQRQHALTRERCCGVTRCEH
jgi:hypothetical protein